MAPHPVSSVDCFSTKLRFDEWDHACSQPGGVQWGARIRQHRGELSAETETILIATGATSANDGHENGVGHATSVHAKLDEQCAELHAWCAAGRLDGGYRGAIEPSDSSSVHHTSKSSICGFNLHQVDMARR